MSTLIGWEDMHDTVSEYYEEVMGMEIPEVPPNFATWATEACAYEEGFTTQKGDRLVWDPPWGYVDLKTKIKFMRQQGFKVPPNWVRGEDGEYMPPKILLKSVGRLPAAMPGETPSERASDAGCPRGYAWYTVVIVTMNTRRRICYDAGTNVVGFLHGAVVEFGGVRGPAVRRGVAERSSEHPPRSAR